MLSDPEGIESATWTPVRLASEWATDADSILGISGYVI